MASAWIRAFAGYYKRVGSDSQTVLAEVSRDENGTWGALVIPFGKSNLCWAISGYRTMAEAKRGAEAGYKSYMTQHRAMSGK